MKRLLLLAFALALVGCQRTGIVPRKDTVKSDSLAPDQVLFGMTTYLVRNGVRVSRVEADTARITQATSNADLLGLTITFFDTVTGRVTSTVRARTGKYDTRNQSLDARGQVVAITTTNDTLRTEHLVYDKIQDRIHSDTSFTLSGATQRSSGKSFEADPAFKVVTVDKLRGREITPGRKRPAARSGGKSK